MTKVKKETFEENTEQAAGNVVSVWHAIYTRPRHEKAVAKHLVERRIEAFLPTYGKFQRWKDRKKLVRFPLFPGYVFVRISRRDRLAVLQLAGVVGFVRFGGSPAEVPEAELYALRIAVETGARLEPHRYLKVGRRVRVYHGPLQDTEGILIRKKSGHRLVLSIDLIQRSVAVEVDAADVTPISEIGRTSNQGMQHSMVAMSAGMTPGAIY